MLPDFHGEGLGRAVVLELLRRGGDRVALTTVAGRLEPDDGVRSFYERCGFEGDDTWWVSRG